MLFRILGAFDARRTARRWLRAALIAAALLGFAESASAQFTITLQPNTLPPATAGTAYNLTVTAVGGDAPYTFDYRGGSPSLPAGLTLHPSGLIDGTPVAPTSATVQIEATDNGGNTGFRTYVFNVGTPGGIGINPATLPNGSQGVAYNQTVSGTGGTGPYTFSLGGGSLPAGLSLASNGQITGTPTGSGPYNFTIDVLDSVGNTGSRAYTVNIGTASLTVNPSTLPNGSLGNAYNQTVTGSGGTGPYTFAISSGALPTGLSMNAAGNITGTPSVAGPYTFTVRATDSVNNTGTRTYNVNIGSNILTVTPPTLPDGTRGQSYSQTFGATGGTGPYTFTLAGGALPAGLSLNSNGTLNGTPTASGTFNFDVQATDTLFNTGTGSYTLVIAAAPLTINPTSLPNGTTGTAYNQTITASNGTAPYSYAVISGALPTGLALNPATGAITGTPSASGSFTFTVQATDATPVTGSRSYTVQIGANILTVSPATVANGTVSVAYSQQLTASGGTGPYTYAVTSGALPAGLTLNGSTGLISGTPSAAGAANFTVGVTDSLANTGSRAYTMNVGTVSLTVDPATLPAPLSGRAYSQTVTAAGGTAPYSFAIASGALPAGLNLNPSTGVISGTPTGSATATFTVQATDANGNIGSRAYTLTSRADPALDPEVQGLINSQVAATRRFASAQIDNVAQRLSSLHSRFDPCGFDAGIALPVQQPNMQLGYAAAPYPGAQQPYGYPAQFNQPYALNQPYAPYGAPPPLQPAPGRGCDGWAANMAFWTAGSFQLGSQTSAGSDNKFTTSGLTAGVDFRLTDSFITGVAVGYGNDRNEIGTNGTRSNGSSFNGALYASWRLFDPLFIDAVVGYGAVEFDNRRFVTGDGTMVSGKRSGSFWFGSATATMELQVDAFKLAPYIRGDFISAKLDRYSEAGSSAQALSYDAMTSTSTAGSIGLRGSIDLPTSFGMVTPQVRVEHRQTQQDGYSQGMYYSDLGSAASSAFAQPAYVTSMTTLGFGVRALSFGGLMVDLEYAYMFGNDAYRAHTLRAALRVPF